MSDGSNPIDLAAGDVVDLGDARKRLRPEPEPEPAEDARPSSSDVADKLMGIIPFMYGAPIEDLAPITIPTDLRKRTTFRFGEFHGAGAERGAHGWRNDVVIVDGMPVGSLLHTLYKDGHIEGGSWVDWRDIDAPRIPGQADVGWLVDQFNKKMEAYGDRLPSNQRPIHRIRPVVTTNVTAQADVRIKRDPSVRDPIPNDLLCANEWLSVNGIELLDDDTPPTEIERGWLSIEQALDVLRNTPDLMTTLDVDRDFGKDDPQQAAAAVWPDRAGEVGVAGWTRPEDMPPIVLVYVHDQFDRGVVLGDGSHRIQYALRVGWHRVPVVLYATIGASLPSEGAVAVEAAGVDAEVQIDQHSPTEFEATLGNGIAFYHVEPWSYVDEWCGDLGIEPLEHGSGLVLVLHDLDMFGSKGQGLGRVLFERVITHAASLGARDAVLEAIPSAVSFWEHMGFQNAAVAGKNTVMRRPIGSGIVAQAQGPEDDGDLGEPTLEDLWPVLGDIDGATAKLGIPEDRSILGQPWDRIKAWLQAMRYDLADSGYHGRYEDFEDPDEDEMWEMMHEAWESFRAELAYMPEPMTIYREVWAPSVDDVRTTALGVSWSYDQMPRGYGKQPGFNPFVVEAQVTDAAVDWVGTVLFAMHGNAGETSKRPEHEIRLWEGAHVTVVGIKHRNGFVAKVVDQPFQATAQTNSRTPTAPALEVWLLNRALRSVDVGAQVELGTGANYGAWVLHLDQPELEDSARQAIDVTISKLGLRPRPVVITTGGVGQMRVASAVTDVELDQFCGEAEAMALEGGVVMSLTVSGYADWPDGGIELTRMDARAPGQGDGSVVLGKLCEMADRADVTLYLEVDPFSPQPEELQAWYGRFGFRPFRHGMRRRPANSKIAAAESRLPVGFESDHSVPSASVGDLSDGQVRDPELDRGWMDTLALARSVPVEKIDPDSTFEFGAYQDDTDAVIEIVWGRQFSPPGAQDWTPETMPTIVVQVDPGWREQPFAVADGYHRAAFAYLLGWPRVPVAIHGFLEVTAAASREQQRRDLAENFAGHRKDLEARGLPTDRQILDLPWEQSFPVHDSVYGEVYLRWREVYDRLKALPSPMIPIYRMVRSPSIDEVSVGGLGLCWSYRRERADSYGAEGGTVPGRGGTKKYLVTAEVDESDVDWPATIVLNADEAFGVEADDESEIRLRFGARVFVKSIETVPRPGYSLRRQDWDVPLQTTAASDRDDYGGEHSPPADGPPLHDLLEGTTFPRDVYETLHHYVQGQPGEGEAISAVRRCRGNPEAPVWIHRAVPPGVDTINPGDWVALSKGYAQEHADGIEGARILSARVQAKDVRNGGNDLVEWGFWGSPRTFNIPKPRRSAAIDIAAAPVNHPLLAALEALRPELAAAAQEDYDAWEQDEDGTHWELGTGGICDRVEASIGARITESIPRVATCDGADDGDDHAWTLVTDGVECYAVDLPAGVYETGGGYRWKKIPGVVIRPEDFVIHHVGKFDQEWEYVFSLRDIDIDELFEDAGTDVTAQSVSDQQADAWYHGSPNDFESFDRGPVFLTRDPQVARRHAGGAGVAYRVTPIIQRTFNASDLVGERTSRYWPPEPEELTALGRQVLSALEARFGDDWAVFNDSGGVWPLLLSGHWGAVEQPVVLEILRRLGFDSFLVREGGEDALAVFDPSNVQIVGREMARTAQSFRLPDLDEVLAAYELTFGVPDDADSEAFMASDLERIQTEYETACATVRNFNGEVWRGLTLRPGEQVWRTLGGTSWTFNRDVAERWEGVPDRTDHETVVLHGRVALSDVNWAATVMLNCLDPDEAEIRIHRGEQIEILDVNGSPESFVMTAGGPKVPETPWGTAGDQIAGHLRQVLHNAWDNYTYSTNDDLAWDEAASWLDQQAARMEASREGDAIRLYRFLEQEPRLEKVGLHWTTNPDLNQALDDDYVFDVDLEGLMGGPEGTWRISALVPLGSIDWTETFFQFLQYPKEEVVVLTDGAPLTVTQVSLAGEPVQVEPMQVTAAATRAAQAQVPDDRSILGMRWESIRAYLESIGFHKEDSFHDVMEWANEDSGIEDDEDDENVEPAWDHHRDRWEEVRAELGNLPSPMVPIYRMVTAASIHDVHVGEIGIFWSFDPDKARAHWGWRNSGKGEFEYLIAAEVNEADVDWPTTVALNLDFSTGEDEGEIRLHSGARVFVTSIDPRYDVSGFSPSPDSTQVFNPPLQTTAQATPPAAKLYYHGRTVDRFHAGTGIYITDSLEYASIYSDGKQVYAFTIPFSTDRIFSIRNPAHVALLREHVDAPAVDSILESRAADEEIDWSTVGLLSNDEHEDADELLASLGFLGLRLKERTGVESLWIFDEANLHPEGMVAPRWWDKAPWERQAADGAGDPGAPSKGPFRLLEIYDMREFDWDSGKYLPLQRGEGAICDRCGREHAKVYVVEDGATGKQYTVGSTCCNRAFDGWEPDKVELSTARKRQRAKQREAVEAREAELVEEVVRRISTTLEHGKSYGGKDYITIPDPVWVKDVPADPESRFSKAQEEWGDLETGTWVWVPAGYTTPGFARDSFGDERMETYVYSYLSNLVDRELATLLPQGQKVVDTTSVRDRARTRLEKMVVRPPSWGEKPPQPDGPPPTTPSGEPSPSARQIVSRARHLHEVQADSASPTQDAFEQMVSAAARQLAASHSIEPSWRGMPGKPKDSYETPPGSLPRWNDPRYSTTPSEIEWWADTVRETCSEMLRALADSMETPGHLRLYRAVQVEKINPRPTQGVGRHWTMDPLLAYPYLGTDREFISPEGDFEDVVLVADIAIDSVDWEGTMKYAKWEKEREIEVLFRAPIHLLGWWALEPQMTRDETYRTDRMGTWVESPMQIVAAGPGKAKAFAEGYIDPSGRFVRVTANGGHERLADRVLKAEFADWDWKAEPELATRGYNNLATWALLFQGWIRVGHVRDPENVGYTTWRWVASMRSAIEDHAISVGATGVVIDILSSMDWCSQTLASFMDDGPDLRRVAATVRTAAPLPAIEKIIPDSDQDREFRQKFPDARPGDFGETGDGYYFNWVNGQVEITNRTHYRQGDENVLHDVIGAVSHTERVVAFQENPTLGSWAATQAGDRGRLKQIVRSLVAYDPRVADYDVYVYHFVYPPSRTDRVNPIDPAGRIGTVPEVLAYNPSELYRPGTELTLYHGTRLNLVPGILQSGLRPGTAVGTSQWDGERSGTYLTNTLLRAKVYADNAWGNDLASSPAILEIKVPVDDRMFRADDDWIRMQGEDEDEFEYPPSYNRWQDSLKESGQVLYLGRIPPTRIRLIDPPSLAEAQARDAQVIQSLGYTPDVTDAQGTDVEDLPWAALMSGLAKTYLVPREVKRKIFESLRDDTYFRDESWKVLRDPKADYLDVLDAMTDIAETMEEARAMDVRERRQQDEEDDDLSLGGPELNAESESERYYRRDYADMAKRIIKEVRDRLAARPAPAVSPQVSASRRGRWDFLIARPTIDDSSRTSALV